jgi:hypothetical protein
MSSSFRGGKNQFKSGGNFIGQQLKGLVLAAKAPRTRRKKVRRKVFEASIADAIIYIDEKCVKKFHRKGFFYTSLHSLIFRPTLSPSR